MHRCQKQITQKHLLINETVSLELRHPKQFSENTECTNRSDSTKINTGLYNYNYLLYKKLPKATIKAASKYPTNTAYREKTQIMQTKLTLSPN